MDVDSDAIYNTIVEKIKGILQTEQELPPYVDLLTIGLNSLTLIQLLVELELEWNFSFPDEDLLLDDLISISKIVDMVRRIMI